MSIKVTEVGKLFNYGTFYDLSASTGLDLKFVSPSGVQTIISNPRVTAPATPVTDPILGTLPASTYMQFTTEATDFTEAGTWTVCGTYTDATPKVFFGDDTTFTVGAAC
tara:strand:+ start:516 stop:842 length:327 start_codon:yes stop_codon:yes gene_type:complete